MCNLWGIRSSDSSSVGEPRNKLVTIDAKKQLRRIIIANSLATGGIKNKIKQGQSGTYQFIPQLTLVHHLHQKHEWLWIYLQFQDVELTVINRRKEAKLEVLFGLLSLNPSILSWKEVEQHISGLEADNFCEDSLWDEVVIPEGYLSSWPKASECNDW